MMAPKAESWKLDTLGPKSLLGAAAAAAGVSRCHSFDVLQRISSGSSSDFEDSLDNEHDEPWPHSWLGSLFSCIRPARMRRNSSKGCGGRRGTVDQAAPGEAGVGTKSHSIRGLAHSLVSLSSSFKTDSDMLPDGTLRSSQSRSTLHPPSPLHRQGPDQLQTGRSSRHSPVLADCLSPAQRLLHTASIGSRLASCSSFFERPSIAPELSASSRHYRYNSCTLPELNEAFRSVPCQCPTSKDHTLGDLLHEDIFTTSHLRYIQSSLSQHGPPSHQPGLMSSGSCRRSPSSVSSCLPNGPGALGVFVATAGSPPASPLRAGDNKGCSFDMRHATRGTTRKCSSHRIQRPATTRELRHGNSCMLPSSATLERERTSAKRQLSRLPSAKFSMDSPYDPGSPMRSLSPKPAPALFTCHSSNFSITGAGTGLPNTVPSSEHDLSMLLSESSTLHLEGEYPMLMAAQLQPSMQGRGRHRSCSYTVLSTHLDTQYQFCKSADPMSSLPVLNHTMLYLDPVMQSRCEAHHHDFMAVNRVSRPFWHVQHTEAYETLAVASGPELDRLRPSNSTDAIFSRPLGRPLLCLRDFQPLHVISKGYAADVHQAYCVVTNSMVILKTYHLQQLDGLAHQHMCREVEILATIAAKQLPHLVQLWAAFQEDEHMVLVLEFCGAGDLHGIVKKHGGKLSETHAVCKVLHPLLQALQGLHAQGVVHRDIKLANICYTRQGQLRLCDLGLAINTHTERAKSCGGTEGYMAPELFTDQYAQVVSYADKPADWLDRLHAKVAQETGGCFESLDPIHVPASGDEKNPAAVYALDIWSLGVTAHYILTGHKPFPDSAAFKLAASQGAAFPESDTANLGLPSLACDFLSRALHPNANMRPTASQLLQHPWITSVMSARRNKTSSSGDQAGSGNTTSLTYN